MCEEDRSRPFYVVPGDRTRDNEHKLECRKFHMNMRAFLLGAGWMLEQLPREGGASITEAFKTWLHRSQGNLLWGWHCSSQGLECCDLQMLLPTSTVLWFLRGQECGADDVMLWKQGNINYSHRQKVDYLKGTAEEFTQLLWCNVTLRENVELTVTSERKARMWANIQHCA